MIEIVYLALVKRTCENVLSLVATKPRLSIGVKMVTFEPLISLVKFHWDELLGLGILHLRVRYFIHSTPLTWHLRLLTSVLPNSSFLLIG